MILPGQKFQKIILVTFHQRIIFALVPKEEEPHHIVAIVMIIYVNVAKMPTAEQKVMSHTYEPRGLND